MATDQAPTDEIEALYELPLDRFVAERNELAKRLKGEGRGEEAEAVRRLEKPSVSAWAANQLARRRRSQMRKLFEAAEAVRKAHERGPGALTEAVDRERKAVDALVREARALLEEWGQAASDATLQRVATTLRAGAGDPEQRALLERGVLAGDLEPRGFEVLAGLSPAKPKPATRKAGEPRRADAREEQRRRQIEEAEQALADARARAREAEREAKAAERAAERARAEADRLQAEVERAEKALASLRRR